MPLYLLPVHLSPDTHAKVLPEYNTEVIRTIRHFVVENIRSARRFLKTIDKSIVIDDLTFYELNKHTDRSRITEYLTPLSQGENIGLLSEAGCPAIADPGADLVAIAQQKGYQVVPLVGPSSILMGLMGSGFNGQQFTFRGYLPIDENDRIKAFKEMQDIVIKRGETQIFIETPYRNQKLLQELIKHCRGSVKLCIAKDITGENEMIRTLSLSDWKVWQGTLDKTPTIFLLGR